MFLDATEGSRTHRLDREVALEVPYREEKLSELD